MSTPDEVIKSWKSLPQREAMMKICDSITETNDLIGQVVRTHLWVDGFINLILYQKSEFCQNKKFASKQKRLFELGLIDEIHKLNKGWLPDWSDEKQFKYNFRHKGGEIDIKVNFHIQNHRNELYFPHYGRGEMIIKELGEDLIKLALWGIE